MFRLQKCNISNYLKSYLNGARLKCHNYGNIVAESDRKVKSDKNARLYKASFWGDDAPIFWGTGLK